MGKKIMRSFRLDEISAVDKPAQEGAKMTIMKRDTQIDDSITKAWVSPTEGAKPFSTFLEQELDSDRYRDAMMEVSGLIFALDDTLRSIAADQDMEVSQKQIAMREAVEAFLQTINEKWPDVQEAISKALTDPQGSHAGNPAGDDIGKKEVSMPDDPKTVADLEKQVADLKLDDNVKKAFDSVVNFAKQVEADKAEAELLASMTDTEKAHMESLSDADKKAFKAMKPEERKKAADDATKKAQDDNPVVYTTADGTEYRKNDDPRLVTMAKQRDEDAKELRKERDARQMADLKKRADDEYPHVPGSIDERAEMLKVIDGLESEDVKKAFQAVFTQSEKLAKAAFSTFGHNNGQVEGTAEDKLNKKADEYAKANSVSFAKAYSEVINTAEGKELYDQSLQEKQTASA